MVRKYDPLTEALAEQAARGLSTVEWSLDQIGDLVGGLPATAAELRQWWGNNSKSQALAWRAAGWHVDRVYLDRRRVRFARGEVGGTNALGRAAPAATDVLPVPRARERHAAGAAFEVRVRLQWLDAGQVTSDAGGKPTFEELDPMPGVYQMTLTGGTTVRPRVYIGESSNLRKRLSGHYRNASGGDTSQRIHALLREHLRAGGRIMLVIATEATIWIDDVAQPLDLTRKAGRLLAENAALVRAKIGDEAEIENLP